MRFAVIIVTINLALAAGVMLAAGLTNRPINTGFHEWQPMTLLSTFQLFVIAMFSFYYWTKTRSASVTIRSGNTIWLLLSAGFVFMAADELLLIHENLDFAIHDVLGIAETSLTDHIDDAILATYFVLGVASLYIYRRQFTQWPHLRLAVIGVGFVVVSLAADVILDSIVVNSNFVILEETLELVAQAFFLGYAIKRLIQVKQMIPPNEPYQPAEREPLSSLSG